MRRHIKREVVFMEPHGKTNRGNPECWVIRYDCGHEETRYPYGHYYALYGVFKRGYKVTMCCGKCGKP